MFSALTFNMQNGQIWDDQDSEGAPIRLEDTLAFLKEQDADLIFLQEVEQGYEGGGQVNPPPHFEWLRARLEGYHGTFGYPIANPVEIPFGLGLSIFSRFPLHRTTRIDLPPANVTFEFKGKKRKPSYRLLLETECDIEGHRVRLVNTHLQAFFMVHASSNDHCRQRNCVEDELRARDMPTLAAGDFNCAPKETVVQQFERAGFQTAQNSEITWRRMPFVLDHIFYNHFFRLEDCKVLPTMASDHHGVRAEFSFVE